jgi:MoaA/NifB/PqqE/SkfB family radical SAM enzyme
MIGRSIDYYIGILREGTRFVPHLLNQAIFLVKKGKPKEAFNYLWAHAFEKEEGAALAEPFYRRNPDWTPYPKRIELEVSTECSLRCLKCEHTYWKEIPRMMEFEQFKHILEQFPTLRAISLSGIGHGMEKREKYLEMIEYLREKSIYIQFFDTFLFVNENVANRLIDLRANKIWMSIDAATPETYKKLQVGSDFNVVVNNAKRLIELKREKKALFPELVFHFIVQKPNVKEMPDFIDLVYDIMRDDPSHLITVQFTRLIPFKENSYLIPDIPQEIVDETVRRAKKYGNFRLEFCNIPDYSERLPVSECTAWTVPFITVSGDAYPCCSLTEANMRSKIRGQSFGTFDVNLFRDDFRDTWYSENFRKFIRAFNRSICPKICYYPRPCPIFNIDKNQVDESI